MVIFDIYMVKSVDTSQTNIFKSLKHKVSQITNTPKDEHSLSVSPDGKKIAFVRGLGTLIIADISNDGLIYKEITLNDSWASEEGLVWSPDSKWVSYSQTDLYFNDEV